MNKLIQVDFYPNGKIVKIYNNGKVKLSEEDSRNMSPKEQLNKRLQEFKKMKGGIKK